MVIATLLVASALMAAITASGTASASQAVAAGRRTFVDLEVIPFQSIDADGMALARWTVDSIMSPVGVHASWADATGLRACPNGPERPRVRIHLLPHLSHLDAFRTGVVARDAETHEPAILIYMPRVREIVRNARRKIDGRAHPMLAGLDVGRVLGLVIAHELGHVLGLPHASRGVMKASPDLSDLLALGYGQLGFEPADADVMQRGVSAVPDACRSRANADKQLFD